MTDEEVVGTVEQVHCSVRRLLRRGLEFHVCTINKSAHTKKSQESYLMILVVGALGMIPKDVGKRMQCMGQEEIVRVICIGLGF